MTTSMLTKKERAFFYASLYLGMLFVSSVVMWWLILVGGQPFSVENIALLDINGKARNEFRPGEVIGVKRKICSSHSVTMQFNPTMVANNGFWYPLQIATIRTSPGCIISTYGLVAPNLPPGSYTYINTVTYQNNLVGRDEYATFPPFEIRILPK